MSGQDDSLPLRRPAPETAEVTPESGAVADSRLGLLLGVALKGSGGPLWMPPTVEHMRQVLLGYEVVDLLGIGGMGAVYQGVQKSLGRSVAIKVLPRMENSDATAVARFKQEAMALAQLSHPGIVAVHDAGETTDGMPYFVMEFVRGTDLARLIRSAGRIEAGRAVMIVAEVCEALQFAHENGFVHRDVKPSNVLMDERGRVKVADFGLAKALKMGSALLTQSQVLMGTPDYLAPEARTAGVELDARADLYAVGVMLYEMLTGQVPRGRFPLPSEMVPLLDPRLDAIIDRAMQLERDRRYPSVLEMRKELERTSSTTGAVTAKWTAATAKSKASAMGGWWGKKRWRWLASAGAALLALLAGWWVFFSELAFVSADKDGVVEPPAPGVYVPLRDESPPSPDGYPKGRWVDVTTLVADRGGAVKASGEWFRLNSNYLRVPGFSAQNAGIRCRFLGREWTSGSMRPELLLRDRKDTAGKATALQMRLTGPNENQMMMRRLSEEKNWVFPLAATHLRERLEPGKVYELEFYAIGRRLIARCNGQTLSMTMEDEPVELGLGAGIFQLSPDVFSNLQVVNLDDVPEDAALRLAGLEMTPLEAFEPGGDWKDLIALVDLPQNGLLGRWQKKDDSLVCPEQPDWTLCEIPLEGHPVSYDLRVRCMRGSGPARALYFPLRVGNGGATVVFDYINIGSDLFRDGLKRAGLETVFSRAVTHADGMWVSRQSWFPQGVMRALLIQVRRGGLKVFVDGELAFSWKGDWADVQQEGILVSSLAKAKKTGIPIFGVGLYQCGMEFYRIQFREVPEDGTLSTP